MKRRSKIKLIIIASLALLVLSTYLAFNIHLHNERKNQYLILQVTESLIRSNNEISSQIEGSLSFLAEKMKDPAISDHAAVWMPKAQNAKKLSQTLLDYIDLQKEKIQEVAGLNQENRFIISRRNSNAVKEIILKNGEGEVLYNKLKKYKIDLLHTLAAPEDYDDVVLKNQTSGDESFFNKRLPINNSIAYEQQYDNAKDTSFNAWVQYYFTNSSPSLAIQILTKFENDILLSEAQIINYCKSQIGEVVVTYSIFQPEITVNPTSVAVGHKVEVIVDFGDDYLQRRPIITIDGITPSINADGKVIYSKVANEPGIKSIRIKGSYIRPDGSRSTIYATPKYMVYKTLPNNYRKISKKNAILGYSYPGKIFRNSQKSINVYVSINNSTGEIKDTLKNLIRLQQEIIDGTDTTHIETENIIFYKYLKVRLIDPDSVFKITKIHDSDRQEIDTIVGNRWRWNITTDSDIPSATLILKISAEQPNEILNDKNIIIHIEVDNLTIFRKIWIYLIDNPNIVVTLILIPLIAYLGKRLLEKKKKEAA